MRTRGYCGRLAAGMLAGLALGLAGCGDTGPAPKLGALTAGDQALMDGLKERDPLLVNLGRALASPPGAFPLSGAEMEKIFSLNNKVRAAVRQALGQQKAWEAAMAKNGAKERTFKSWTPDKYPAMASQLRDNLLAGFYLNEGRLPAETRAEIKKESAELAILIGARLK
jgi:hypothetical protein